MSSDSDKSEDTDEFIRSIRMHSQPYNEAFPHSSEHKDLLQLIQEEEPPYHLDSTISSPMKYEGQYTAPDCDVTLRRDVDKVLESLGHFNDKSTEFNLTDEDNELINVTRERNLNISDSIDTPMNSTPRHKMTSQFQPVSLLTSQSEPLLDLVPPSPPEVFMTPMRDFSHPPNTEWSDKEIKSLQNKIFRQTLEHKAELDEHVSREIAAKQRLEKSQKDNHDIIQDMKSQMSKMQHKIHELQSEKVNLAVHLSSIPTEGQQPNEEEFFQLKQIAEHYKSIVLEQDSKVSSLERIIESKTAEIYTLNCQIGDKEKAFQEMSEELKEQARNFAVEQNRKETEANNMLNKTQKFHHREKVLSVAKIQEDLSQTHSEEVLQLKQSLSEEKNRALSRLEETFTHKFSKSEETSKKVEKELGIAVKKAEEKDDSIKNMEMQRKNEVHRLNTEIQKLQSNLQRTTKESTLNRSQAVARARQESEDSNQHRIQQAVAASQKSQQAEIQKLKSSLKKVTDELTGVREQNTQLVRRGKDRLAAQWEFEHSLTHQLTDEVHQHSIVGIASSKQRRSVMTEKRIGGSMSCLADIGNMKKESVESVLKVLKIANEDLRKRVRELEQRVDAEKKKMKQMEQDHQIRVKKLKREIERDPHTKHGNSKEKLEKLMKELESSNASLREYIHTLEEEIKSAREDVMSDPRVVEALNLLSKLQKRLRVISEEKTHLQEEIQKLCDIIDKLNISPHSNSPFSTQVFNEKIHEYSQLQNKYKVLLREKMELERLSTEQFI